MKIANFNNYLFSYKRCKHVQTNDLSFFTRMQWVTSSEINLIESSSIKSGLKTFVSTVCIDGYKFVIADGTVQFFIKEKDKIVPAKCETK